MATRKSPTPVLPSASSLMRRLVEAAEALPYGATAYIVADEAFPHTVYALDQKISKEIEEALRKNRGSKLYGPIKSTPSTYDGSENPSLKGAKTLAALGGPQMWVHDWDSEWEWVGRQIQPTGLARAKAKAPTVTLAETAKALGFEADKAARIDAIVVGEAAFRKFVMPYLVNIYGLDEAAKRANPRG